MLFLRDHVGQQAYRLLVGHFHGTREIWRTGFIGAIIYGMAETSRSTNPDAPWSFIGYSQGGRGNMGQGEKLGTMIRVTDDRERRIKELVAEEGVTTAVFVRLPKGMSKAVALCWLLDRVDVVLAPELPDQRSAFKDEIERAVSRLFPNRGRQRIVEKIDVVGYYYRRAVNA